MALSYIPYVTLIAVAVIFVQFLISCLSQTGRIPGPFAARLSRFWYLAKVLRGKFEIENVELHRRYGPLVRIAPNQYSVDDPQSMKTIYGHATKFTKGPWYEASSNAHSALKDLFTERDSKKHAAFRRKVANLYSMTSILRMESSADHNIELVLDRLSDCARSGVDVDIPHMMQCYAFDVIAEITLGKRFGFLDRGEDSTGMFSALHAYLQYGSSVGIFSEYHKIISTVKAKISSGGLNHVVGFVAQQIQNRMAGSGSEKSMVEGDFLSQVLEMHKENPEAFTFEHVFITCMTNIGAGSDTTSISLSSVLYYLLKSPWALQKLREEIDANTPKDRILTFQEAQKLPYLQTCFKEALRMHPATGLPLSRVVPQGGATIAGQFFPEGSIVGVNTWVAHRNEEVFGSDASSFRPERWLIEDKEQLARMENYYLPFGAGSRTCIGKNISLMEMTKLIPRLISRFDFELTQPNKDLECVNVWFVKQTNLFCKVKMRNRA